ncbi:MAG TPA: DUF5317 family protein [Chloroflexota bacterium]|nr:DUF5317 family protein [Chloroflexota bacterium]
MTFGVLSWSLLLAVALALALGGDFKRLGSIRIHAWWVLALAPTVKIALLATHTPQSWWAQPLIFLLVAVGAVANWRLPGVPAIALGLLLNASVVAANHGLMPYTVAAQPDGVSGETNALSKPQDASTPLAVLDDRIPFPPTHQVLSFGDIAIMAGGIWLVLGLTEPKRLALFRQRKKPLVSSEARPGA